MKNKTYKVEVKHIYKESKNMIYKIEALSSEHARQLVSYKLNSVEYISNITLA